jgi:outer membrane lipoprotein carrier protein
MNCIYSRIFPRFSRKLPLLIVLLAALPSLSRAAAGDDVIRRVQTKFQSLKALSVHFDMTYSASDSTVTKFAGKLFLGSPGHFRMESAAQTIVSDGQTLWTYSPDQKQVIIYNPAGNDHPLLTPQQLLFEYPEKYSIKSVKQDKLNSLTCDLLVMTPKDPSDPTKALQIWVDRQESFTRRFQLEDLAGSVTTFDFKDFKTGSSFPDSTYTFAPPAGVEVVDMRGNKKPTTNH